MPGFADLLDEFCAAVAEGDGRRFAALFAEDGEYDDVFYGLHQGRAAIADMLENKFHRDGRDFCWQMIDPVDDGTTGYARWIFSYVGKLPHIADRRVLMEGVGLFKLKGGRIRRYEDMARTGELMLQLGLPTDRMLRVLGRMGEQQMAKAEVQAHLQARR
jgi:hypothetical protein